MVPPQTVKVVNTTGSSVPVRINPAYNKVRIAANGNTVTLAPGTRVGLDPTLSQVSLAPYGNGVRVLSDVHATAVDVSASRVLVNGLGIQLPVYEVPEGKRLLVEFVSAVARTYQGQPTSPLVFQDGPVGAELFVPPAYAGDAGGRNQFVASQAARRVVDDELYVEYFQDEIAQAPGTFVKVTVYGYLIDRP